MLITPANLQNLFTGFKASFNTGFRAAAPMWDKIATMVPSSTSMEDYAWMGQFPQLREWVGDRVLKSIAGQKYTLVNKDFESTIEVLRPKIADDEFGIFGPLGDNGVALTNADLDACHGHQGPVQWDGKKVVEHPAKSLDVNSNPQDREARKTPAPRKIPTSADDSAGNWGLGIVFAVLTVIYAIVRWIRRKASAGN